MRLSIILLTSLIVCRPFACVAGDPRADSVTNGLQFLSKAGPAFQAKKGCITCHHGPMTSWALSASLRIVDSVDEGPIREVDQKLRTRFAGGTGKKDTKNWWRPVQAAFWILGQPEEWNPTDDPEATEVLVEAILRHQNKDGSWTAAKQFTGQRRPKGEAHLLQTMWNTLALARLNTDETAVVESRDRAIAWVREAKSPEATDVRAVQVLIEQQFGSEDGTRELLNGLINDQNDDGSWGWLAKEDGDAWATGLTLFVLSHLESVPSEPVENAQRYLVARQTDDGSWEVPTKLTSGKHSSVISSYFGTAWSVIGLARTESAASAD